MKMESIAELTNDKLKEEIKQFEFNRRNLEFQTNIEKVSILISLLEATTVDENQGFGSEPKMIPAIRENDHREAIEKKIMQLINKF